MEMKADIAGKPKDSMFHKIYIQKHENVRYDRFIMIYIFSRVIRGYATSIISANKFQINGKLVDY